MNVSFASTVLSVTTGTCTVALVTPEAKVTVPLPPVKSAGEVAVPLAVVAVTVTVCVELRRQGHCERRRGRAAGALGDGDVVDGQRRQG